MGFYRGHETEMQMDDLTRLRRGYDAGVFTAAELAREASEPESTVHRTLTDPDANPRYSLVRALVHAADRIEARRAEVTPT